MAETLPYMMSTGTIPKILAKIKEAATPDRFSQDFLSTVLGFASGNAKPFIPLAKRLGLLNSDGSPTDLYRRYRGSEEESRAAMATAIRTGYAPLFKRNEYAYKLDRKKLEGLVKEITGAESGSSTVTATVSSFEALKALADFESKPSLAAGGDEPIPSAYEEPAQSGVFAAPLEGGRTTGLHNQP